MFDRTAATTTTTQTRARFALALIGLEGTWLAFAEMWREAAPIRLLVFVLVPWMLLALAWYSVLPAGASPPARTKTKTETEPAPPDSNASTTSFRSRAGALLGRRLGLTLRIIAMLVLLDVVIDIASPYPSRFAYVSWEAARALAVVVAGVIAERATQTTLSLAGVIACKILRMMSLGVALTIPLAMLYIGVTGARDEAGPADAALVLGFALDDAGQARPQLVARMDRGTDLYRRGLVPRLIVSGGAAKAGHTEASVMRDLALTRGVPAEAIVLDESARSTIENFACSLPILERLGARRGKILVVTEPWHMRRAMLLARRHGIDARAAPATSTIWQSPRYATYWLFRDAIAFVVECAKSPWASPGTCASTDCEGCRRF